ncbi:MAG: hemerythrin domain-containing protein [Deltaproteobacteria bacterium]|nr:hemerythrin domain-containing protein [Deltaproteobacteria bacterium]
MRGARRGGESYPARHVNLTAVCRVSPADDPPRILVTLARALHRRPRKSLGGNCRMATQRSKARTKQSTTARTRDRKRKPPRRKTTAPANDAIAFLTRDHRKLQSLLSGLQAAQGTARRQSLLAQTEALLKQHTELEEALFYPAFREAAQSKRDRQMFHEATEEHHTVDLVLPEVKQAQHEPDVFAARAKVLKELVTHHIDEERSELFPRARKLLDRETLREIGAQMAERRRAAARPGPLQAVGQLIGLGS